MTFQVRPLMSNELSNLLAEYDEWRDERADLSADSEYGNDGWADSDDKGCDLAMRLAEALRTALCPPSNESGT